MSGCFEMKILACINHFYHSSPESALTFLEREIRFYKNSGSSESFFSLFLRNYFHRCSVLLQKNVTTPLHFICSFSCSIYCICSFLEALCIFFFRFPKIFEGKVSWKTFTNAITYTILRTCPHDLAPAWNAHPRQFWNNGRGFPLWILKK